MKKDTLIRVVVMVVALLAASYLANILTPMQKEISIEKGELTKAPIAGLHKIMADLLNHFLRSAVAGNHHCGVALSKTHCPVNQKRGY